MALPKYRIIDGKTHVLETLASHLLAIGTECVHFHELPMGRYEVIGYRKARRSGQMLKTANWPIPDRTDTVHVVKVLDEKNRIRFRIDAIARYVIPEGEKR